MYSFQNYGLPQITGAQPTQWAGLGNFTTTFADSEFWLSLRITVVFAAVVVPLTLIAGTLVGLLLNRLGKKMAAFVSTAALLAWATPPVSASVLFYWLFNPDGGLVDWTLSKLPHWLAGSTNWAGFNWTTSGALPAYAVLTILVIWQSFPFVAVTVLAGLKTVPAELYEAARVDGATPHGSSGRSPTAAEADLPGPAAAVGDLGLQRLHPDLHPDRLPREPGRVQPVALHLRQGLRRLPARLQSRRRAGADLHADPAGSRPSAMSAPPSGRERST